MNAGNVSHDCGRTDDNGRAVAPSVVTCGNCDRSWCERCDPCPSALCPWCHGRGYSTAPIGQPTPYDQAIAYATELGTEHGTNAAGWVTDGNTDLETFKGLATMLEDGNPEVWDSLPSADLSGQMAGELTGPQLCEEACDAAGIEADSDQAADIFNEICDAYGFAFNDAVQAEVSRICAYHLAEPTFSDLLETPPAGCSAVADLFHWSTNYDAGKGPATLFLDMLGITQEEYGTHLYDLTDPSSLGYVELEKLTAALAEYVSSPESVRTFVGALLNAEDK